jgi:hypothetical protein
MKNFQLTKDKAKRTVIQIKPHREALVRLIASEYFQNERNISSALEMIIDFFVDNGMPQYGGLVKHDFEAKVLEKFAYLQTIEAPEPEPVKKVYASIEEQNVDEFYQRELVDRTYGDDYNKSYFTREDFRYKSMYNCFFDKLEKREIKTKQYDKVPGHFLKEQLERACMRYSREYVINKNVICPTSPALMGINPFAPALLSGKQFDVWRVFDCPPGTMQGYWIYFRFFKHKTKNDLGEECWFVEYVPTDPNGFDKEDYIELGLQEYMPFFFDYSSDRIEEVVQRVDRGRNPYPCKNRFEPDHLQPIIVSGHDDPELKPFKYWESTDPSYEV